MQDSIGAPFDVILQMRAWTSAPLPKHTLLCSVAPSKHNFGSKAHIFPPIFTTKWSAFTSTTVPMTDSPIVGTYCFLYALPEAPADVKATPAGFENKLLKICFIPNLPWNSFEFRLKNHEERQTRLLSFWSPESMRFTTVRNLWHETPLRWRERFFSRARNILNKILSTCGLFPASPYARNSQSCEVIPELYRSYNTRHGSSPNITERALFCYSLALD